MSQLRRRRPACHRHIGILRTGRTHIIDPATGEPTADLASVTIVGPDLTYADAYATAVFVMGLDGLNWLAERHPDDSAFLITRDDTALSTSNFADHRVS